ncbi:MAG: hypothetical protein EOP10_25520 [Proteobacteria bacterium]|nr:MAG: hypothetical protein EOP10_25520 [Pseudomonadota bacterium]
MNPSPLQLEHYELASLQIEPIEGYVAAAEAKYPSFDHADFESSVEFGQAERGDEAPNYLWGIKLRLRGEPKEGESFPYRFDVSVIGFLNGEGLVESKHTLQDLVLVNGTSLLYGVLRDEVLRLTSRMRHGALLLPTASFHSLANTHGSGKTEEDKSSVNGGPAKRRQPKA